MTRRLAFAALLVAALLLGYVQPVRAADMAVRAMCRGGAAETLTAWQQ